MNLKAIVKCMIYGRNSNKSNHHQISRTPQNIFTNTHSRTRTRTKTLLTHKWQSQSHYSELESIPQTHTQTETETETHSHTSKNVWEQHLWDMCSHHKHTLIRTYIHSDNEREGVVEWEKEIDSINTCTDTARELRLSSKVCWGF